MVKIARIICATMVFSILSGACGVKSLNPPVSSVTGTFDYADAEALAVYVSDTSADRFRFWDRASYIAQMHGFMIEFRPVMFDNGADAFADMISANPGGVYITKDDELAAFYDRFPDFELLLKTGLICDVHDQAIAAAPKYLEYAMNFNATGSLISMPLDYTGRAEYMCVLVRDDLGYRYEDMRTLSDMERVLRAAKAFSPGSEPSCGMNMLRVFQLLLVENGYTFIDSMFYGGMYDQAVPCHLWLNKNTNQVYTYLELLDMCAKAVAVYKTWLGDGLVGYSAPEYWANYPIVFTDFATMKYYIDSDKIGSLSGYTMSVMPELSQEYYCVKTLAAAAPETDVSEFLRFIEWLHDEPANYMRFMFGIEGVDYGKIDGEILSIWESEYAKWSHKYNRNFLRDDLELSLYGEMILGIKGFPDAMLEAQINSEFPLNLYARRVVGKDLYTNVKYRQASLGGIVAQELGTALNRAKTSYNSNMTPEEFKKWLDDGLNVQWSAKEFADTVALPKKLVEEAILWQH